MENLIEELTKVNPANLSEEGLKLFNKINEIIDRNEELEELPAYTNYLEEKLMYALGPKHKEFSDMTKSEFAKIFKKSFINKADTYTIHKDLINYYNNM